MLKRHYYKLYMILAAVLPMGLLFIAKLLEQLLNGLPMLVYSLLIDVFALCYSFVLLLKLMKAQRLNDYFVELKFPWCRWHFIMQSVKKKHIVGMTCRQIANDFSKQASKVFAKLKPKHIYIADTHETIIRRLERNPHIKILEQELSRQSTMKLTQKKFLNKKCEKSCSKDEQKLCLLQKGLAEKRNMYFIRFEQI